MAKKLQKSIDFSDFFNNLIDLCEIRDTSPTTLAKKFANKSTLTAWKHGTVDTNLIPKLAQELNVSIENLIIGTEKKVEKLSASEHELILNFRKLSERDQIKLIGRAELLAEQSEEKLRLDPPTIKLKHSYYKVSAGKGFELDEGDSWEEIYIPDTPESRKADMCLTIMGDSMEPTYKDGDIVLVREQAAVDLGEIGIFIVEGKGYIKKFDEGRLISINNNYDDIMFADYDPDSIRCVGAVIGRV